MVRGKMNALKGVVHPYYILKEHLGIWGASVYVTKVELCAFFSSSI